MELYHKQNVVALTNIAFYGDLSVKQAAFDPIAKEVQLYKACPDVEGGFRFFRLSKFAFDLKDLDAVINNMATLKDNDELIVELSVKATKRLVFSFNEQYGNWELGFQMKKPVQKRKAVVVDLSQDDIDQPSSGGMRVELLKPEYEGIRNYDCVKFKKSENFDLMIDRLLEFRREIFDEYPHFRNEFSQMVHYDSNEFDQNYFKRNLDIFKYLTYQMGFDQESRSVSRIALLRQYANDLKAISSTFDLNLFIKNEKKASEYCRILKETRNQVREEKGSSSSSSTYTRSQQPSKKPKL